MKVAFCCQHHTYGGLANNGGSATILKMVAHLRKLGHQADVVTQHKDKFHFFRHPKPIRHIPKDADVCIAVSSNDIKPMLARMPKRAKPFYWARLLDAPAKISEEKLIKYASRVKTLVNSEGLRDWFAERGVPTSICYQGVDVEDWADDFRGVSKPTVGFLVSTKKRKHFDVVKDIVRGLGSEYDYIGYGAKADQDRCTMGFTARNFLYFKVNQRRDELCHMYSSVDIWCATSTQEGLHNPPMEAALCGSAVVYPDAPMAGCSDHCIDGETAWRYRAKDAQDACRAIRQADRSRNAAHKKMILEKIGSREMAAERLLECLR